MNANASIKVKLCDEFMIVYVNGETEKLIEDNVPSTSGLASQPLEFETKYGQLSISFNLKRSQLTLKHNGYDVEMLPQVKKELPKICRNKTTKF